AEQRHRQAQGHAGPTTSAAGDSLKDHLATPPEYVTVASALGLLLAGCLGALGWVVCQRLQRPTLGSILLALGASVLLSIVWYLVATCRTRASRQASITLLRVLLTRWLTRAT